MNCNYCHQTINRNLTLKEIFLPQKILSEQLCSRCMKTFQLLEKKDSCQGCQRQSTQTAYCKDCLRWQQIYPNYNFQHEALFSYNQAMQEWFELYKFKGDYRLRHSFVPYLQSYFKQKKSFLAIPMPISKERMEVRGFNQVEGLLDAAGIPYEPHLIRFAHGLSQVQKTRKERLSLKQPFKLTQEGQKAVLNRDIILVDDIYTTGRTLFHGAQVILANHPAKLYTFSLAR
ncbi:amidophosphoribosyltransferase [Enterococcus ureilyticus]|uniref:Amidophosphoribosyltransferase n=1 Tax=Enterococcus ureilyticus TaxID=1131292 RepID=A0A1E5HGE3_9ENTE|nr:ComF family protein [Enterococcus ureilyticus]MBM7689700.1 competence protein ComFC [Enterococcus ureilyticus]MBO0445746.1 ComF family protein [Enterococcus ureilyticus]OEG24028.1 amidophosphoribosyltransferase [Enterococcus ureilyticus]